MFENREKFQINQEEYNQNLNFLFSDDSDVASLAVFFSKLYSIHQAKRYFMFSTAS
jgi:hypothetical protein